MSYLSDEQLKDVENKANRIRLSIVESLNEANSGHLAGPLGMADVFATLYFSVLKHDPKNPNMENRDIVVLSNGHICPVLYATMAHSGYFEIDELKTLRKFGSRLQGHPHREFLPGIETSSGPLGSGLSQALGMALSDRIDKKTDRYFYCFMGDGELNCGQVWEAFMLSGKEKLHNLIAIIDRNNIQIDGLTEDIMPLEPLKDKFESFNWDVLVIDGHSINSIYEAFNNAKSIGRPTVIIANTIPSKGIKEFERDYRWHGAPPGKGPEDKVKKEDQKEFAIEQIKKLL